MAEDVKGAAGPKQVLDKLTELLTVLRGAGGAADPDGKKAPDAAAGVEAAAADLTDVVRQVRQRYDESTKWVVAAFAAVGLLVFGSLPFTKAASQPLWASGPSRLLVGLILSASGLAIVLWARTRSLEPQDASLGEMAETLGKPGAPLLRPGWRTRFWKGPPWAANKALKGILEGAEGSAHLGPGIEPRRKEAAAFVGVRGLIQKIGLVDGDVLGAQRTHACADAELEAFRAALDDSETKLAALVKQRQEAKDTVAGALDDAIAAREAQRAELSVRYRARVSVEATARTALAMVLVDRDTYFAHRDLVLVESAVAQMRGAFRVARRFLLLGGLATVFGAALYASALPADDTAASSAAPKAASNGGLTPLQPVKLAIAADAGKVDSACRRADLLGLLVSSDDVDAAGDGPFTAIVTGPDGLPAQCLGQISIADGQGSYQRR